MAVLLVVALASVAGYRLEEEHHQQVSSRSTVAAGKDHGRDEDSHQQQQRAQHHLSTVRRRGEALPAGIDENPGERLVIHGLSKLGPLLTDDQNLVWLDGLRSKGTAVLFFTAANAKRGEQLWADAAERARQKGKGLPAFGATVAQARVNRFTGAGPKRLQFPRDGLDDLDPVPTDGLSVSGGDGLNTLLKPLQQPLGQEERERRVFFLSSLGKAQTQVTVLTSNCDSIDWAEKEWEDQNRAAGVTQIAPVRGYIPGAGDRDWCAQEALRKAQEAQQPKKVWADGKERKCCAVSVSIANGPCKDDLTQEECATAASPAQNNGKQWGYAWTEGRCTVKEDGMYCVKQ